jgi:hypothetical protein
VFYFVECVGGSVGFSWVKISRNLGIVGFALRKGEHMVFSPFILGSACVGQGFTVTWRIRLDVTVRVFQEREEILVGSESFDGPSVGGQESK